jgi:hypothetical protein
MYGAPPPDSMPIRVTHLWFRDTGRYGRAGIDRQLWIAGISAPTCCDTLNAEAIVSPRQETAVFLAAAGHRA